MPSEDQIGHMTQQQQQQSSQTVSKSSTANVNTNPNSTISKDIASVTNAFKEKKKLVRRAFSMPRNLFRLSRRVKNTNSSSTANTASSTDANPKTPASNSNSCNQAVQTNSDEETKLNMENVVNNKPKTLPVSSSSTEMSNMNSKQQKQQQQQQHLPEAKTQSEQDNKHRLFRRSTWKKFLFSRFILQSINLKVILTVFSYLSNVHFQYAHDFFVLCSCIYNVDKSRRILYRSLNNVKSIFCFV